jgi:uncharacterized protein
VARILLLLFIAFLIYLVIKGLLRVGKKKGEPPAQAAADTPAGEDMVACALCGVNVPRSETHEIEGRRVCASNPNCIARPK